MERPIEEPELHFFRRTPPNLLDRPPLRSSLQSFESCLFLIGLRRYPHAFTACVFAIEGALKAAFAIPPEDKSTDLRDMLKEAHRRLPTIFPEKDLQQVRETRNRIVHYGFSPKDDRVTASLVLQSAAPYLARVYESFFQLDLYDSLLPEFRDQLRNALEVFRKLEKQPNVDPTRCLFVLAHLVRWRIRDSLGTVWEAELASSVEATGLKFEKVRWWKSLIQSSLAPGWSFDCPICGTPEALHCQIVESELKDRRIKLSGGLCYECDLVIPKAAPFLAPGGARHLARGLACQQCAILIGLDQLRHRPLL